VPSEKRSRKRAARDAKLEELARQQRRRSAIRRGVLIAVIAAVVIGIVVLVNATKKKSKAATSATTTTVGANTPVTTATTSVSLTGYTTSADCPADVHGALHKPQWSTPPPMTINPAKNYAATVRTDVGTFTIAMAAKESPVTTNSFVFLANNHFYDCVTFHRVIQGFVVQGGDPTGTGTGGAGYTVQGEVPKSGHYPLYAVAMAKTGSEPSGTTGSQFYIVSGAQGTSLPPQYAYLGLVTSGTNVIQKIDADGAPASDPSGTGQPKVTHRMISVTVTES
jgi:peptidyl-prolyl cis-trans isomerase B (cyclophilin B)